VPSDLPLAAPAQVHERAVPPAGTKLPDVAAKPAKVGRRRILPALKAHGGKSWYRWRYPFTRRTPLLYEASYNPVTLAAERHLVNPAPVLWSVALLLLAVAPPLFGNNSFVGAATLFEMYAAINVIWMLQIGTAGIFSLASLATVGFAAYGTAVLSVYLGFPWWAMWLVGPFLGLVFGVLITIPAIRLEGFYYALLTVGISELCRVYTGQSQWLGAANGGLFGASSFVPDSMSDWHGIVLGFYVGFALLLGALLLYRMINGQRLGRLLRAAPERHEAFAEALGINYRAVRIQVFLISSAALGSVGGFYATLLHGATPSLFTIDQLLLLLAMIVIGGIGTSGGAVVGTLIVVLLDDVFIGLGPSRLVLIAAVMLGTVLFLRDGLFGAPAQYRAWVGKRQSERRAARSGQGGEVMPEEASEIADKQAIYAKRFDATVRAELKRLITDQLIVEHLTTMGKRRSDALERVLAYFRRAAVADKYAVLAVKPFAEYRIVALSGRRGVPPRTVDDQVFKAPEEALHGVFLKRVRDLMES